MVLTSKNTQNNWLPTAHRWEKMTRDVFKTMHYWKKNDHIVKKLNHAKEK